MPRTLLVLLLAGLGGCRFDTSFPAGAVVACAADADCVDSQTHCDATLRRCVSSTSPFKTTSTLRPLRGRVGDVFSVGLTATGVTPEQVAVAALTPSGELAGRFEFELASSTWRWQPDGTEPEGVVRVFASLESTAPGASVTLVELGSVELDFTSPACTVASLSVVALADNALVLAGLPEALTAARPGAAVNGTFELSEAGNSLPLARLVAVDAGLVDTLTVTQVGAGFSFAGALSSARAQGTLQLELEAYDLVGNRAVMHVASLQVLVGPAQAPDVDAEQAIVLHRAPRGSFAEPLPRMWVEGRAGAAQGAAIVATSAGLVLNRGKLGADGSFALDFNADHDRDTVSLQAIDAAGNTSPVVEVRNVDWTVSALSWDAGLREAGDLQPWEGRWSSASVSSGTWNTTGGVALFEPNGQVGGAQLPLLRSGLVGTETWLGGQRLVRQANVASDPVRAVTYDFESDRFFRFGGGPFNNPVAAPEPAPDGGPIPAARHYAGLQWMPKLRAALLFGGELGQLPLDDAWLFDGVVFTPLAVPTPPARTQFSMAWDPERERVVLFGGLGALGAPIGDTWVFVDGGFAELAGPNPPARGGASLEWDDGHRRLLLVGGVFADGGGLATDTWVHDGTRWSQLDAGRYAPAPSGRLVVDPLSGAAIWSGGSVLVDEHWQPVQVAANAPGVLSATGYHPVRGAVMAVGGGAVDHSACSDWDDCYSTTPVPPVLTEWRDWGWKIVSTNAGALPPLLGGRLGWEQSRDALLLYDVTVMQSADRTTGLYNWKEDGGWRFEPMPPGGANGRIRPFMLWDEVARKLLVHGGGLDDGGLSRETWQLDPQGWTALGLGPELTSRRNVQTSVSSGSTPPVEWYVPFFNVSYRWVAEAGSSRSILPTPVATADWSAGWGWLSTAPFSAPPVLTRHPISGLVLAIRNGEVLTLAANTWTRQPIPGLVVGAGDVAEADPMRAQVLLFGGTDQYGQPVLPARVLDFSLGRPVQEFAVPLEAIGLAPADLVTEAEVRVRATAQSEGLDGGVQSGVLALVRLDGRLQPWPAAGEVHTDGAEVTVRVADRGLLQRWLRRRDGVQPDVGIGLTSGGTNGRGTAGLSTSQFELVIRYRRGGP